MEVATKEHVFAQIGVLNKILIAAIFIFPILAIIIANQLVQSSIMGAFEISSINVTPSPIQAKITVSEPAWYRTNANPPAGFSLTRGYAPFPVFFQGWESTVRDEIIDYEWNFGDSGAIGKNYNNLHGFNSAHVFEQPGNYNVTLKVKNRQGQISTASISVEVLARPEAKKYYVDYVIGDDSYTGLCQTAPESGNCGPWKTASKAFGNLNYRYSYGSSVLFKRGGTYPISTTTAVQVYIEGVLFGAYGEGAKPIIEYTGTVNSNRIIDAKYKSHDVYFQDLNFKFKNPFASARLYGLIRAIDQSRGFLFLRVDAEDPRNTFFALGGPSAAAMANEAITTGVYMIDSSIRLNYYGVTATDPKFEGSMMMWGYIGNLALIGNSYDKSYNLIAYLTHLNKAVIVDNNFSRPAFSKSALRIAGNLVNNKGTNNIYVADNRIMGWRDPVYDTFDRGTHTGSGRYNLQLVKIGPNEGTDQSVSDVIFERNIVTNCEQAMMISDATSIIVRNNLFVTPNQQGSIGGTLVIGEPGVEKRPNSNITVVGNTFAIQSKVKTPTMPSSAIFISPYDKTQGTTYGGEHSNIKIYNNLFYRPVGSSVILTSVSYATDALMPELHFDGNLYYNAASADGKIFLLGTTAHDLSGWRNLGYSYDLNSQSQVQPLFNQTPVFNAYANGSPLSLEENISQANIYKEMFRLSSDPANPAIDKGVNVNNYLHYDFTRNERPDGSLANGTNYDVGAYEITKAPAPPIAACVENWSCASYQPTVCDASRIQTRTCSDANNCGTVVNKPSENQNCTYNSGGGGGGGSTGGGGGAVTPPSVPSVSPSTTNFDSALSVSVSTQGSIIKVNATDRPAVYYVIGGKKYLFVNRVTYSSWSSNAGDNANNFSTLKKISQAEFDSISTGGNLVVKPTWLIKFDDSPIVYAVGSGGKLYKLADLAAQKALFGSYAPAVIQSGFRDNYYDHGNSVGTLTASSQKPQ